MTTIEFELSTTKAALETSTIKELRETAAMHNIDLTGRNRSKKTIIEAILENARKGLEQGSAPTVEASPEEKPVLEQLLSREGYKGHRIDESNYSRQYENGAFVPQYQDGSGRWKSYYKHTANRYSVKQGMKSQNSTTITYKSAKGALSYLLKQGLVTL